MKKLIMTAIVICLSIATAIPFSSVMAETILPSSQVGAVQDSSNNDIGNYTIDQITTTSSSSDKISLNPYGIVNDMQYKYGEIIHVVLDHYYSGSIEIQFQISLSLWEYVDVIGDGVGSWRSSGTGSAKMVIYISDCNSFDVYLFDDSTAPSSPFPTSIKGGSDLTLSSINDIIASLPGYQIPYYSIPAYAFATTTPNTIQYENGDLAPYYTITSGMNSRSIQVRSGTTDKFVFVASVNLSTSNVLINNNNVSMSLSTLQPYNYGSGYRVYVISISNSNLSSQTIQLTYNTSFNLIPIWFGDESHMPEEIYSFVNGGHVYSTVLFNILNAIQGTNTSDNTAQDVSDIADSMDDITDQEHDITSGFLDDLDDFNENIDLQDYDFLTGIANSAQYFKTQLENVFNSSVNLRAMWVLPVICVVLMALLGGR